MDEGYEGIAIKRSANTVLDRVESPRSIRETLMLFSEYHPDEGVASITDQVDFRNTTRRQVCYSTSGRGPASLSDLQSDGRYDGRSDFERAICSEEFQRGIRERVVLAFPEKRRAVFIHIPKCAGSDLTAAMREKYPVLHLSISNVRGCNQREFFSALRDLVLAIPQSDTIGFGGHVELRWYVNGNHIRLDDELFTIVREPRQMVYSAVSYVLTQMVRSNQKNRQTNSWLQGMGLGSIPEEPSESYLQGLGSQILRIGKAVRPNSICQSLGRGTAETAVELAVLSDIEITDTQRFSAWRDQRFAVKREFSINKSLPLFRPDQATPDDLDYVESLVGEDIKVYDKIKSKLDASERLSIRGSALA